MKAKFIERNSTTDLEEEKKEDVNKTPDGANFYRSLQAALTGETLGEGSCGLVVLTVAGSRESLVRTARRCSLPASRMGRWPFQSNIGGKSPCKQRISF